MQASLMSCGPKTLTLSGVLGVSTTSFHGSIPKLGEINQPEPLCVLSVVVVHSTKKSPFTVDCLPHSESSASYMHSGTKGMIVIAAAAQ